MSAETRAAAIQRKIEEAGITEEVEAEAVLIHELRRELEEDELWH